MHLKANKTSGSDGLVGELLKYGGSGFVYLLVHARALIFFSSVAGGDCAYK